MIFAAGFGTRMGHLTKNTPKSMIEVAGRPLLEHAISPAEDLGLNIVVNAHYHAAKVEAYLRGRTIKIVVEEPEILDTGGGLKNALPHLPGEAAFAMNSDAAWAGPNPLKILADAWRPSKMDALLLLVPLERTVGYTRPGSFETDPTGRLIKSSRGDVYTGAQIVKTAAFADMPNGAFSFWKLWNIWLERRTAYGVIYPGMWADVGTPDGIGLAEDMLSYV
ncbi:nucleotidyltransferase [Litoreibacter roseus]|uniref:Nucleotidyltransferase n=2 Tax=Litoreibacter roseus TaxID=2601869 RepID=A0A6N6JEJ3_9RHOB|nr:nucleotidyltransferase [Litoreibacter roseus]